MTLYLVVLQFSPNVFTDVATFILCRNIRLISLFRLLRTDVTTLTCWSLIDVATLPLSVWSSNLMSRHFCSNVVTLGLVALKSSASVFS